VRANENCKNVTLLSVVDFKNWLDFPLPNGGSFFAEFYEYCCLECATQIALDAEEIPLHNDSGGKLTSVR
jgi:hypothetical protein